MHDGEFDFLNLLYEFSGFGVMVLDACKIAADAVFEILRFSYVDDGVIFVKIAIHARLFGECG